MPRPLSITAFHGSGTCIESFDYRFTNKGNDQLGSGFYFTSSLEEAISYTSHRLDDGQLAKLGGEDQPTVHVVSLSFKGAINAEEELPISTALATKIILRSPVLDAALLDWGDVEYEGRQQVLSRALESYTHKHGDGPTINRLFGIANDFFPNHIEAFNRALYDVLKMDGIIKSIGAATHFVAFFPEQIEIIERIDSETAQARLKRQDAYPRSRPKA